MVSLGQVLLAVLVVGAPGLGFCFLLLRPGSASPAVWAAAVVPFGYAFVGLVALLLALLHQLTGPAFFAAYAVGTLAAWGFGLRRHSFRENARDWRTRILADRWQYVMGLVTIAALTVERARFSPIINLQAQTPLRYWADGVEIADAHRIPTESLQWGQLYPPAVSKIVLNTFNAAMSLVLGRGPLRADGGASVRGVGRADHRGMGAGPRARPAVDWRRWCRSCCLRTTPSCPAS